MSARMVIQPSAGIIPVESRPLIAGCKAVCWPMHEGAGTTIAELLGNGPAFALQGTPGSEWANWGYISPNGSDHLAFTGAQPVPGYLDDICRFDTLNGQELLIGFMIRHDGDATTNETFFSYGRLSTSGNVNGGWALNLSGGEQIGLNFSPRDASAINTNTFGNSAVAAAVDLVYIIQVLGTSETTADMVMRSYRLDTLASAVGSASLTDLTLNGTAPPTVAVDTATPGLLFANRTNVVGVSRVFGAAAGSNGRLNNLWIARLDAPVTGLWDSCAADMAVAPREFPRSLRA